MLLFHLLGKCVSATSSSSSNQQHRHHLSVLLDADCGGKADIVFLLDKSGSVGQSNFNKMLEFVKDVSSNFDIGPNDVQIGVDTFSTSFSTEFTLGKFADKHGVSAAVDRIP